MLIVDKSIRQALFAFWEDVFKIQYRLRFPLRSYHELDEENYCFSINIIYIVKNQFVDTFRHVLP